jgi:hypothetical protein
MLTPLSLLPQLETWVRDAADVNDDMASMAMPAALANTDFDTIFTLWAVVLCQID